MPASWRLLYGTPSGQWAPVRGSSDYGTAMDQFNRVTFEAVETTAIRIAAQLQPQWSGGILKWEVEEAPSSPTTASAKAGN